MMRTPIGLLRMCTLSQGATRSVAHMMNSMNKVLRDCILDITMPFLDDIPKKGCLEPGKDESLDQDGCRRFVSDHIEDNEGVSYKEYLKVQGSRSLQKNRHSSNMRSW